MNSSSVNYDFITMRNDLQVNKLNQIYNENQNVTHKTQQIAKITDQGRLFCPNFNPSYQDSLRSNVNTFKKGKGMCAETYNRAASYGPGIRPFRKFK